MNGKHRRQEDVDGMTTAELERLKRALQDEIDFPAKSGTLEDDK